MLVVIFLCNNRFSSFITSNIPHIQSVANSLKLKIFILFEYAKLII
jgi:hypothetical protein